MAVISSDLRHHRDRSLAGYAIAKSLCTRAEFYPALVHRLRTMPARCPYKH